MGPAVRRFRNSIFKAILQRRSIHTYFLGGYYLNSNLTKWLSNAGVSAELAAAESAASAHTVYGTAKWAVDTAEALVNASNAHGIASLISAALSQIGPSGGVGFIGDSADTFAMQQTIANVVAPALNLVQAAGVTVRADGSIVIGVSWFGIPVSATISAGGKVSVGLGAPADVGASTINEPGLNVASGSTSGTTVLKGTSGPGGTDVLIGLGGPTQMYGGSGANTLTGGTGDTTLYGGAGSNTFEFSDVDSIPNTLETVAVHKVGDQLIVNGTKITGTSAGGSNYLWTDTSSGTQYLFTPEQGFKESGLGTLVISNGTLGANNGDQITVQNFNLTSAQSTTGDMGIFLGGAVFLKREGQ